MTDVNYENVKTSLGASLVRTVVPLVVGAVVAGLAKVKLNIDQAALEQLVGAAVAAVYYGVVRVAEERVSPAIGWFLGWAKAPKYSATPVGTVPVPEVPAPAPVAGSDDDDVPPLDTP